MRLVPAVPNGKLIRLELASCDTLELAASAQNCPKTDHTPSNWCISTGLPLSPIIASCKDLATMNPADQQRRMLEMQHKIRNDAQQQQHYLGEFADWNRDIAKKDKERRAAPTDLPPVRGGMRVGVRNSAVKPDAGAAQHRQQSAKAPGAHVYDKGYKKWEQFDADNYDIDEEATTVVGEVQMRRPKIIV